MKTVYIAVVGPQFADPVDLVSYLAFRYHVPMTRIWMFHDVHHHDPSATDSDSILECSVMVEPDIMLVFQAPVHAIWDLSRTYKYLLTHADIIVHMLCTAKRSQRLNIRDFDTLFSEYQQLSRHVSCITLLNDGGYGDQSSDKLAPEQVQALCLNACEPIVTAFQGRNSRQRCGEDIDIIVGKILVLSRCLSQDRAHIVGYENIHKQHYSAQLTPNGHAP